LLTKKKITFAVYIFLCLFGSFLIFYATASELWAGSDSVEYYEVARNIAAGRGTVVIRASGLIVPLYLRPPLYPITLSIARFTGINMLEFNRYLNIGLFSVFLLALGWSANLSDQNSSYAICFTTLIITSPTFIHVFSGAMSESIFFTLGVLSVALLVQYLRTKNRRYLSISAVLAGLATLTRFNGVAFIFLGAFMIVWQWKWRITKAWRDLFLFVCISLAPVLLWLIGLFKVGYTPGIYNNESMDIWKTLTHFRVSLVELMWKWFPGFSIFGNQNYRGMLYIIALFMVGLFLLVLVCHKRKKADRNITLAQAGTYQIVIWSSLFILFILIHAFSYVFVEHPRPALDNRVFSPVQLCFLGVILSSLFSLSDTNYRRGFHWILIGIFMVSTVASYIPQTVSTLSELSKNESSITSNSWRSSDVMQELKRLPESIPIISNNTAAIIFYTERPAYEISELVEGIPQEIFQPFGQNPDHVDERVFRDQGAVLVLFTDGIFSQFWPIYQQKTKSRLDSLTLGLNVYYSGQDGAIYFYDATGE
jgi:hypothetical protein